MRVITENDEVSDPFYLVKIYTFLLPNLTNNFLNWMIQESLSFQMRGSIRVLFSLFLLLAIVTSLSSKIATRRSFSSFPTENVFEMKQSVPELNSTLLKFAAIDIGEMKVKQEIEQLLQSSYGFTQGRYRSISSWQQRTQIDKQSRYSNRGIPNHLLSPKYYRNWLDFRRILHDWFKNKKFQPEIMSQLIKLVKNPIDQHYGFLSNSKTRYSSCAVVGNSGILLKSEYGDLIDDHEFVIRLNNAGIKGYEKNVGSRTSISFVNSNILHLCARKGSCSCHPYGENVPIIMYICQAIHLMDYTICNSSHKAPLLITDARFDVLCSRIVKYYSLKLFTEETRKSPEEWGPTHDGSIFHYSSGFQAVMLSLGICDKVSIFGFGKSPIAKHHYHTNQKSELHLHDYEAEYAFYRDLVERSKVIPFLISKFKIPPVVMYH